MTPTICSTSIRILSQTSKSKKRKGWGTFPLLLCKHGRKRADFYDLTFICRMGRDPHMSVINEHNESHEVRNLFVTDASTFPSSSGVNPMLTIMSIAHQAAQYIKAIV